jgi:hypothetical protein
MILFTPLTRHASRNYRRGVDPDGHAVIPGAGVDLRSPSVEAVAGGEPEH